MIEEKSQNFDEDFQNGLKMIIGSYEGKFQNMEAEIAGLNEVINQKQDIIDDLEKKIKFLMIENKDVEDQKAKLFSENQYLLEVIENLTKEAKKLEKFKKNILSSIECENEGSVNPSSIQSSNLDKFKYIPKKIAKGNYNFHPSKSIQSLSINSTERNYNTNLMNTYETNKSSEKDNKILMNINNISRTTEANAYDKKEFKLDNEKIDELIEKLNESLNKRINSDESKASKSEKANKSKDNLDNKIFDLKKKFKDKKNSTSKVQKNDKEIANNSYRVNYNN